MNNIIKAVKNFQIEFQGSPARRRQQGGPGEAGTGQRSREDNRNGLKQRLVTLRTRIIIIFKATLLCCLKCNLFPFRFAANYRNSSTDSQSTLSVFTLSASLIHFSSCDQSCHNQLFRHSSGIDKNSLRPNVIIVQLLIRMAQYIENLSSELYQHAQYKTKNCAKCKELLELHHYSMFS